MCIGNTTSPAATNTTNVSYNDPWEQPEVNAPQKLGGDELYHKGDYLPQRKSSLKTRKGIGKRAQSAKTSGGTY